MVQERIDAGWRAFPAHVGMNRGRLTGIDSTRSVPRACGDEPVEGDKRGAMSGRSPRMRG